MTEQRYKSCIEICHACAIACDRCASADLREKDIAIMTNCINLNRECSAFCRTAAHIMSVGGRFSKDICALCATVCDACAQECEKHQMTHCVICAVECRNCARECRNTATML